MEPLPGGGASDMRERKAQERDAAYKQATTPMFKHSLMRGKAARTGGAGGSDDGDNKTQKNQHGGHQN